MLFYEVAGIIYKAKEDDLPYLLKSFAVSKVWRIKVSLEVLKDLRFDNDTWDLAENEAQLIRRALQAFGTVTEAANALGLKKTTLVSKMEKYKIDGPRSKRK